LRSLHLNWAVARTSESGRMFHAGLYCGERLPAGSTTVPNPMPIVEVLSPGTSAIDRAPKLRACFQFPSLHHYLIVWAGRPRIVHRYRNDTGAIETVLLTSGEIRLDPPGIAISVEHFYID